MKDATTISWKDRMKVMEALIMTVKSMANLMVNNDRGKPDGLTIKTLEGMTRMVSTIAVKLELSPEDVDMLVGRLDKQEEAINKILEDGNLSDTTIDDFIRPNA